MTRVVMCEQQRGCGHAPVALMKTPTHASALQLCSGCYCNLYKPFMWVGIIFMAARHKCSRIHKGTLNATLNMENFSIIIPQNSLHAISRPSVSACFKVHIYQAEKLKCILSRSEAPPAVIHQSVV